MVYCIFLSLSLSLSLSTLRSLENQCTLLGFDPSLIIWRKKSVVCLIWSYQIIHSTHRSIYFTLHRNLRAAFSYDVLPSTEARYPIQFPSLDALGVILDEDIAKPHSFTHVLGATWYLTLTNSCARLSAISKRTPTVDWHFACVILYRKWASAESRVSPLLIICSLTDDARAGETFLKYSLVSVGSLTSEI